MPQFLEPVDLARNELRNAVLQNLATPPANPMPGLSYFDTTLNAARTWTGTEWSNLGGLSAADRTKLDGIQAEATKNATDAHLLARANHTGTQAISTVTNLQSALDGKEASGTAAALVSAHASGTGVHSIAGVSGLQTALDAKLNANLRGVANGVASLDANVLVPPAQLPDATTTVKGAMTGADKTKLNGIAAGATANSTDAQLRDRATHTGAQAISTVTGLQTALDAKLNASARGAANGVASLDAGSKIPINQLPALAITTPFEVASQAAMLALDAQEGDVAIRSDISKTFILQQEPASTLANWKELLSPTGGVANIGAAAPITSTGGTSPTIGITDATTAARGAMSAADKTKLDGIAAGATANVGTVRKFAATIGNGSATSFTVTHNFNTRDVIVAVYEAGSPFALVYPGIAATTLNAVTISFSVAPAANQYRVVVTA